MASLVFIMPISCPSNMFWSQTWNSSVNGTVVNDLIRLLHWTYWRRAEWTAGKEDSRGFYLFWWPILIDHAIRPCLPGSYFCSLDVMIILYDMSFFSFLQTSSLWTHHLKAWSKIFIWKQFQVREAFREKSKHSKEQRNLCMTWMKCNWLI